MRVLVLGAFGFIGSHVAAALAGAGHEVVWAGRRARSDRPSIAADLARDSDPAVWRSRLVGIEAVVNCAGILREGAGGSFRAVHVEGPRALFTACEQAGVRRVVHVSAAGVGPDVPVEYASTKAEGDALLGATMLDWVVLRPSLVYGRGSHGMAQFAALAALPAAIPLVGDGCQPFQPISVEELARAILSLTEHPGPLRVIVDAVGPKPIAMRDLLAATRRWLGLQPGFFVEIPSALIGAGARVGDVFGRGPYTTTGLRMLARGNIGDYQRFRATVGFDALPFEEGLAQRPAQREDLWLARLHLLRPWLRFSIALLWIATGILSAFVWPVEDSYRLLAAAGIGGWTAPLMLFGAAALDVALGLATLFSRRLALVGMIQIALMAGYSAVITLALPEFWLHPFGPVLKNIPIIVATLIMIVLESRR
jgi:uncharacterized protein YbjT (DUF2867 family)